MTTTPAMIRTSWETPGWLFKKLNAEFHFTLDACATCENAKTYYLDPCDGSSLLRRWEGTVWCNPPYGRALGRWVAKAAHEARQGCTVVMLLPNRTDSPWFHEHVWGKAEVRFIRGRIHFVGGGRPRFGSMIVIFRPLKDLLERGVFTGERFRT